MRGRHQNFEDPITWNRVIRKTKLYLLGFFLGHPLVWIRKQLNVMISPFSFKIIKEKFFLLLAYCGVYIPNSILQVLFTVIIVKAQLNLNSTLCKLEWLHNYSLTNFQGTYRQPGCWFSVCNLILTQLERRPQNVKQPK
jgi:hypothetical protein